MKRKLIDLGRVEFHTPRNAALIERFYAVVTDLRNSGATVDVWLMDIATVLREHGYDLRIYRTPATWHPQ